MTQEQEVRVTWREGKKCPRVKLRSLNVNLTIHFDGDEPYRGRVVRIPSGDLEKIAQYHPGPPSHWTVTAMPNPGTIRETQWQVK